MQSDNPPDVVFWFLEDQPVRERLKVARNKRTRRLVALRQKLQLSSARPVQP